MRKGLGKIPNALWLASVCLLSLASCAEILGVEPAKCSKAGCPGVAVPSAKPQMSARPVADIKDAQTSDGDAQGLEDAQSNIPDAEGGGPKDKVELCHDYCAAVTSRCEEGLPQYKNEAGCNLVCQGVLSTAADAKKNTDNTIECRIEVASAPLDTTDAGFSESCVAAGLMGTSCGGECANYCSFMESFCSDEYAELGDCMEACANVPRSTEPFFNDLPYADHLECRIAHIQLAALDATNRDLHCGHAAGKPGPCETVYTKEDLCAQYCDEVTKDCGARLPQYKNEEGCNLLCNALFTPASETDTANTIQCRTEKAKLANLVSDGFAENCVSAGPIGTYCGGACENYCELMETHCEEAYETLGDCMDTCENVPRSSEPFSQFLPYANHLECRFAHIQLATVDPDSRPLHCGHAAGGPGPCAPSDP